MRLGRTGGGSRPGRKPIRFLFIFCALLAACSLLSSAADIPCVWTSVDKIVAVGDLHGDYDNFVLILKSTGLVDDALHWTGGRTHLVQTGDILDRGTRARDILDLLMRLETEAPKAGGMVHVLLGNHEEMNIDGIVLDYADYVTLEQFVSFLPDDFRKAREKEYLAGLTAAERAAVEKRGLDLASDRALRLFWTNVKKGDAAGRAYISGFNTVYGRWLLQKNAVIKINDIVFAHAGISPKYSHWKLRDINATLRSELEFFRGRMLNPQAIAKPFHPQIVYDAEGPLWYRGLAFENEGSSQKDVDRLLNSLGARAIVVGHSYVRADGNSPVISQDVESVSRFHNRVFVIDTGISRVYGGVPSALIVSEGRFSLWLPAAETGTKAAVIASPEAMAPSSLDGDEFLQAAAVVNVEKGTVAGRMDPWKVTLRHGGTTRKALFKYIDRRRPDILPESYRYELAAYALSRGLGLSIVPPVVEREIEGRPGSLQIFVENPLKEGERKERRIEPPHPDAFARDMADVKVFASLAGDVCTNDEDTLINRNEWNVYRVDFAQAFEVGDGNGRGCEISQCSRRLFQALLDWDEEGMKALLAPYLNDEEWRALDARRDTLVRAIKGRIKARGEHAVLL